MSTFRQPASQADMPLYIFEEGVVTAEDPVGQFAVAKDSAQYCLQKIQIGEIEGKVLVAIPQSDWSRTVAQRVLPFNAFSKLKTHFG